MLPRSRRKILSLAFVTALSMAVMGASSAFAGQATTTRFVALTGSVGAGTSCASPGYIGVPGAQAAMDAANSGDTIHLCAGTWNTADTTNNAGFEVDKALTIEGDSQTQTILDGSGRTRPVIEATVGGSPPGNITVRSMTIRDGFAEAPSAISVVSASLLVEDVTVQNSTSFFAAVGVLGGGSLVIRRSTLIGGANSGLVFAQGPLAIEDSTLRDNAAPFVGGVIRVQDGGEAETTIDSSTFSGLSGPCVSSVADSSSDGVADTGDISITNSTFTGNTVTDGDCDVHAHIASSGSLTMESSTFAGNTGVPDNDNDDGELLSTTTMTLGNNIIVGDPNAEATCQPGSGTTTSLAGNVISDGTIGCDSFVGGAAPSLQTKVLESTIEIGPLADNGGPTETMALGAASVARGAAISANCPEVDQRGVTRGTPCTSGAWQEASPSAKPTVKQKGRAGKDSLTVRVRCAGSGPCRIRMSGVLKGGKGKLKSKTVKVRAGGKTVELPYTSLLERELRSNGGSGSVRVRAKEIGGGSASTLVRVTLPDPVTG